jgi:L-ascorbate metabolism protein UlaG (beta-lactamase superfamily)
MRVEYLGGPTAILDSGGVRMLTDPTFTRRASEPHSDAIPTDAGSSLLRHPDAHAQVPAVVVVVAGTTLVVPL